MSWILTTLYLVLSIQDYIQKMDFSHGSDIIVQLSHSIEHGDHVDSRPCITYSGDELRDLGQKYLLNSKWRSVPNYSTLRNIKQLRINKRRIRFKKVTKAERHVNHANLTKLPSDPQQPMLNSKNIKVATVNARSIRTSVNLILDVLSTEGIDLLVITESWLTKGDESVSWLNAQGFNALGYKHDSVPRPGRRRGGGLLLVYKKSFTLLSNKKVDIPFCEAHVWKLAKHNQCISVLGIYHPPYNAATHLPPDSLFITDFADAVASLIPDHRSLVVSGDFNIHINDCSNDDAIFLLDAMSSLGFKQHVSTSTHRCGNTIDLLFTNVDNIPVEKCIVGDFVSDHRIVIGYTKLNNPPLTSKQIKIRNYTEDNIQALSADIDISAMMDSVTPDAAVMCYERELTDKLNKHIPIQLKTVRERPRVPWFDMWLKDQRKVVRHRQKAWIKYGQDHHWLAYKRERNRFKNMLIYNKRSYLSDKIMKTKGDAKALYQLTNNLTTTIKENPLPDTPAEQLANDFANFFLNKILTIRENFKNLPTPDLHEKPHVPNFTCFAPLSQETVRGLILSMKTKSCELDPIPTHVLKEILPIMLPAITKIVNLSLINGEFPPQWKNAIVRPLLKKAGAELTYKNYRPVSNLQFISKVTERAVLLQFMDHCNQHDLIPDYQSAYRQGYSCETSVLCLLNQALWAMENQEITACLLLDLSAAFDTVDHDLFISIMKERFNIQGKALQWFETYLRPRSFCVHVDGKISDTKDLSFSVPQGSAAGANFFVAYCESLPQNIPAGVALQGFADDHFIHNHFKASDRCSEGLAISQLREAFANIQAWMQEMRLKLNSDKTEFILIGNQVQLNKLSTKSIELNTNTTIPVSDTVRCLGTLIDKNLKFTQHVTAKCKVAMANFVRILNIRKYLSRQACETLIVSLVMSHLDYGNSILAGSPDVLIAKYQRIQNMCTKLILNRSKYDSSTEALKTLHWLPIRLRIMYKILCLTHKCLYGIAPVYLKSLLTIKKPIRTLRSTSDDQLLLEIPRTKRKTFAARSFSVKAPEY